MTGPWFHLRGRAAQCIKSIYVGVLLPFSLCSSLVLFNEYASALQYVMHVSQVTNILHYLDDYFTLAHPILPYAKII